MLYILRKRPNYGRDHGDVALNLLKFRGGQGDSKGKEIHLDLQTF